MEIQIRGASVPVTKEEGITDEVAKMALTAKSFTSWVQKCNQAEDFTVRSVHFQSVDKFGPRIGFIKFKADIASKDGQFIPGIAFIRGGAVAILVVLTCEGKEYSVLTVQPRVPIGNFNYAEIPAGMLDDSGNFTGVAAKELEEETGISIFRDELVDLIQLGYGDGMEGMYPSAGGCDEFLRLFLYRQEVPKSKLEELEGKCTGVYEEGEMITVKIVPLADLWKVSPDSKTLSALFLYERLQKEGKIPRLDFEVTTVEEQHPLVSEGKGGKGKGKKGNEPGRKTRACCIL